MALDLYHRPFGYFAPEDPGGFLMCVGLPALLPVLSCDALQPQQFSCKPDLLLPFPSRQSPFFPSPSSFTPSLTPRILALIHIYALHFPELLGFTFSGKI